jgi:rRNA maturation endonuclease Nob1
VDKKLTYTKKCANCGVVFETRYGQQIYCKPCGYCTYGRYKPHPRPKIEKICPICGEKFLAYQGFTELANPFQKYCSPECQGIAQRQRKAEFASKWSDGTKVR